ncbi:MAG: alpha/beta hydrolase [Gemmatimonadetes bacterium]|nr:alpha/beta hydrolase [Gemmatimonadota bacterium]
MRSSLPLAAAAIIALATASPSQVRVERVTFTSGGERVAADLYLPRDVSASAPAPALVVTGAWMTVKEQMAARYAREMADRGFVALAFDFRGWGQSGGSRRQYEDPASKIADIRAAAAYLATRPEAARGRLGGLGICASSGYMAEAAASAPGIRSVALVAPWLHDREVVEQTYGGAAGVARLIASGDSADAAFRTSGRQRFVPAASLTDRSAIMYGVPYYTEADRGMIREWRNQADPAFWRGWLTFDAMPAAPRIRQPFLMVHSDSAAIPQGARRFYGRVTAPKSELWLPSVTQLDFYDRPAPVRAASDAVAEHFRATLASR